MTTQTSHDLASKAMLVKLSISQWTARKHDKNATRTVENAYSATEAGRFNKVLIAQEAIKAVEKVANQARTFHYDNTQPWGDDGFRILAAANFNHYSSAMREFHVAVDNAANEFESNYPALVADAKIRLNGLFNPADYPKHIRDRFSFDVQISPLPIAGDFRVSLQAEEMAAIQAAIEDRTMQSLQAGHRDLYRRLAEAVSHMADKLGTADAIFRNSLVDNLAELCQLLPRLDIMGDAELGKLRQTAEDKLLRYDAETLRQNPVARVETARDAAAILDAMKGMYDAG